MSSKLTCASAQKLIRPYLDDELGARDRASFVAHIRECETCRRELETAYIVDYAIRYLDEDKMDHFDINGLLDEQIETGKKRMLYRQVMSGVIWSLIILMGVIIVLLLIRLIVPDLFGSIMEFVSSKAKMLPISQKITG